MSKFFIYNAILTDVDGTEWDEKTMSNSSTYYSAPISVRKSSGYASLLVKSSAGSLAITYEVSNDKVEWFTPLDTDANDLSSINAAMTVDTTGVWRVFEPQIAEWIRIKIVVSSAESTVSAWCAIKEQL